MTFSSSSVYLLEQLQNSEKQFAYQIFCCLVSKSCLTLLQPHGLYCSPSGPSVHGISQAKKKAKTGMGCHFLLQSIFLTQGSNPRLLYLLHWQVISLPLSYQASHLLDFYLIMKGAARQRQNARCGEKCPSSQTLTESALSPNFHVSTHLEAFQTLSFWVFLEASLHTHDQLNDSTSNPNPFPEGQEQEGKFQSSNHMVDSLGNLPPFLGGAQESTQ